MFGSPLLAALLLRFRALRCVRLGAVDRRCAESRDAERPDDSRMRRRSVHPGGDAP